MKVLIDVPGLFIRRFKPYSHVCRHGDRACDAMALGSLMLALKNVGLMSDPWGEDALRISPDSMWHKLKKVEFSPLTRSSYLSDFISHHKKCDLKNEWESMLLAAKETWPTALNQALKDFVRSAKPVTSIIIIYILYSSSSDIERIARPYPSAPFSRQQLRHRNWPYRRYPYHVGPTAVTTCRD